jgi:ATP-binding cassette subfamily C protein CydC
MTLFLTGAERRALRRVLRLLEVDARGVAVSVLLGVLWLGSAIGLAATSAWLIARASQQPPVLSLTVAAVAVRMFGISRALMRYLQRLASHRVALTGMDALRQNLYDALASARVDRVAALRRGDLLARTGADVDDVGDLVVKALLPAAVTAIVGAGTVAGIALLSPASALILAGCLVVSGVLTPLLLMRAARVAEEESRSARTDLAATAMSVMDGAAELQISGALPRLHRHLRDVEDALSRSASRAARLSGAASGIDRIAMGAAVVGALLVGVPQTASGQVAAVALAVLVLTPLSSFEGTAELSGAATQLVRSASAAVRIDELLGHDTPVTAHPVPASPDGPRLVARGLAVGWPGGPVVARGIDLEVGPGSRLALVGPSGIGKSTLLATLAGLLAPVEGTVTLDGCDVWGGDRADVTARVTMTAEDAHVFDTTVLENLRVADPGLTAEQARRLLATAGLGEWLDRLPGGLDTLLGPGGTAVSGGERRRLLLARAVAAPAPLMLLDEPAEHLDPPTADALMRVLLATGSRGRGVVVATHRLSALDGADLVLVLDRPAPGAPARVVARGTHEELTRRSDRYRWAVEQEA